MKRRDLLKTTAVAALPAPASILQGRGEETCEYIKQAVKHHVKDGVMFTESLPEEDAVIFHGSGTPPYPMLQMADEEPGLKSVRHKLPNGHLSVYGDDGVGDGFDWTVEITINEQR